jgi:hypothetical protein
VSKAALRVSYTQQAVLNNNRQKAAGENVVRMAAAEATVVAATDLMPVAVTTTANNGNGDGDGDGDSDSSNGDNCNNIHAERSCSQLALLRVSYFQHHL